MKYSRMITTDDIVEMVATHYGLSSDDIRGKKRDRQTAEARGVAMYLIRKRMKITYPKIGEYFSRDHSFVIYYSQKVEQRIRSDNDFKDYIHNINEKLNAYQY